MFRLRHAWWFLWNVHPAKVAAPFRFLEAAFITLLVVLVLVLVYRAVLFIVTLGPFPFIGLLLIAFGAVIFWRFSTPEADKKQ